MKKSVLAMWIVLLAAAGMALAQEKRKPLPFAAAGCLETQVAPTIDGKLDDPAWQRAGRAERFVLLSTGEKAREETVVYLLFDKASLYVGFHCKESEMGSIKGTVRERDVTEVAADDSVEVFLVPPESESLRQVPEPERYFHLMLNVLGTQFDEIGIGNPKSWDTKWTSAVSRGKDYWEAEIAIPFSALSTAPPQGGATWKANFNRGEKRLHENSSWSAAYGSFHDPEHFGCLVFVSKPEDAQKIEATALREGLLLPRAQETLRRTMQTAEALRKLKAGLPQAQEAGRLLQESEQRLTQLQTQIRSLSPEDIVAQKDALDNELSQVGRKVDACADRALLFGSYTAEQLAGKAPAPAYCLLVSPAITNERLVAHVSAIPARAGKELACSGCRGEYESVSATVYALEDLKGLLVSASDLTGPGGAIPADAVDIYAVKCWYQAGREIWDTKHRIYVPELLLKDDRLVRVDTEKQENYLRSTAPDGTETYLLCSGPTSENLKDVRPVDAAALQPVDVPADSLKQFWLTVHIPEDAKPGTYEGTVRFAAGQATQQMPLKVTVHPFDLLGSRLIYSIYYGAHLSKDGRPTISSTGKSEEQYRAEIKDLKAHGVLYPTNYQGMDETLLRRMLEIRKEVGMPGGPFYTLGCSTGAPKDAGSLDSLRRSVRQWIEFCKPFGYDEVYFYGIDEAKDEQLKSQQAAWKAVQEAGGKTFVACYKKTFEAMGPLLNCAVLAGRPDPEEAKKWHSVGSKTFCYAYPQVGNEEPETYRRHFGLVLWKAGFDGGMDFAYQWSMGHIWNDFDDPHYRDHNFTYPTVNGVVGTVQWEGFREAVDDVRYVTTLEKAIAGASEPKRALAAQARAWLETVDVETADLYQTRAQMAEWILKLTQ